MYLLEKGTELNLDYLGKVLGTFQTRDLPVLNKMWKYYKGNQKILQKKPTDTGKFCNKIVVNFCYNIVQNYLGYLSGIPIKYSNDDFKEVLDVLNYNDVHMEDAEYLRQALIFGKAYECNYIDEDGQQRFRLLDSRECIPIYSNDLDNDLLYVVRFYREDLLDKVNENYIVEVYGNSDIKTYRSGPGFSSFSLISEVPNYFNQCPVTVFSLNEDEESVFGQVITLQDAYNQLISDEVDDFDAFCDAYLLLKGVIADSEDLEAMKRNRVLMVDSDADANYLTKSVSDTQVENMLKNIKDNIHKISNSPDFQDEKFLAQSGIAMKYKLVGFENAASGIEANMKKALQRRIELISNILHLTGTDKMWRDVEIRFTRNLPISLEPSSPAELMQYQGLVSDETLLKLIPFVKDVNEELSLIRKQEESAINVYDFGHVEEVNEE